MTDMSLLNKLFYIGIIMNIFKKVTRVIKFSGFMLLAFITACKDYQTSDEKEKQEEQQMIALIETIKTVDDIADIDQAVDINSFIDGRYSADETEIPLDRRLAVSRILCDYAEKHKATIDNEDSQYDYNLYETFYDTRLNLLIKKEEKQPSEKNHQAVYEQALHLAEFVAPHFSGQGYIDVAGLSLIDMGKKEQAYQLVSDYYKDKKFIEMPEFANEYDEELTAFLNKNAQSPMTLNDEQKDNRKAFFAKHKQALIKNPAQEVIRLTPDNYKTVITDSEFQRLLSKDTYLNWNVYNNEIYYVKGDVYVDGDLSVSSDNENLQKIFGHVEGKKWIAYIIDGNLIVDGTLHDDQYTGSILWVRGSVVAQNVLHHDSTVEIDGSLTVNELLYGSYNHGELDAHKTVTAPIVYSTDDHSMSGGDYAFFAADISIHGMSLGFVDKPLGELLTIHPFLFENFDRVSDIILKEKRPIIKPQYHLSEVKTLPKVDYQ